MQLICFWWLSPTQLQLARTRFPTSCPHWAGNTSKKKICCAWRDITENIEETTRNRGQRQWSMKWRAICQEFKLSNDSAYKRIGWNIWQNHHSYYYVLESKANLFAVLGIVKDFNRKHHRRPRMKQTRLSSIFKIYFIKHTTTKILKSKI